MLAAVRACMAALAALYLWWGAWAWWKLKQFFTTFPGFGHHWTAAYPPYNEHLLKDLGATFLTLGFILVVGAAVRSRAARLLALFAVLVFNALHLQFHAANRGHMPSVEFQLSLLALTLGAFVPVALLVVDWLAHRAKVSRPGGGAAAGEGAA